MHPKCGRLPGYCALATVACRIQTGVGVLLGCRVYVSEWLYAAVYEGWEHPPLSLSFAQPYASYTSATSTAARRYQQQCTSLPSLMSLSPSKRALTLKLDTFAQDMTLLIRSSRLPTPRCGPDEHQSLHPKFDDVGTFRTAANIPSLSSYASGLSGNSLINLFVPAKLGTLVWPSSVPFSLMLALFSCGPDPQEAGQVSTATGVIANCALHTRHREHNRIRR